jgi:multiple sugar transport system ATP-binding protein
VVLGIRPESVHDAELTRDADPAAILELPIELREELGSEVHVHAATGGGARLAAAVSAETTGAPARLHVDLTALHFFDPATGESLRG